MERAVQGGVERAGFKGIENALRFRFLSRGIYVSLVELGGCRGTPIGNRGTLGQRLILLGIEVR